MSFYAKYPATGGGGSGANTALSNIASTAIPADLVFDYSFGSRSITFSTRTSGAASTALSLIGASTTSGANGADGGAVNITGGTTFGSNGGDVAITGGIAGSNSGARGGNLTLTPGNVGGGFQTVGAIKLNDLSGTITTGQVWTATASDGSGHWAAGGGGLTNPLPNNTTLAWENAASSGTIPVLNVTIGDAIRLGYGGTMGGMTVHSTNGVDIDASSTDAGKIGLFCTLIDVQGDGTTAPELRLWDGNDNNHLGILAPQALTANTTWTLPNGNGSAGQVLTTNGAIPNATLSWTTLNGANTALSNLAATSINQNLLPDSSSNYRHLGAMSNMWAGLHVNVLYDSSDNNCISFDGTGAVRMMHYAAGTATFDASGNISSATAVSGTFANPTSITVVHGLITAIS